MKTMAMLAALAALSSVPALAADPALIAAAKKEGTVVWYTTQIVDHATMTLNDFRSDQSMGAFRELLKTARGVLILPAVAGGSASVGTSGGNGVLLLRDKNDQWSGPAFYTIEGASFASRGSGEQAEAILLLMTDTAVKAFAGPRDDPFFFSLLGNGTTYAGFTTCTNAGGCFLGECDRSVGRRQAALGVPGSLRN